MSATSVAAPSGTVTMLFTDIEGSSDGVRTLGTDNWEATARWRRSTNSR